MNVGMTYAFHCIGKREEAAKNFCAIMNIRQPAMFKQYNHGLLQVTKDVCFQSVRKSVEETRSK